MTKRVSLIIVTLAILLFGIPHGLQVTVTAEASGGGPVMLIGGALRTDNVEVYEEIGALAGGKGKARIAVIPLAALDPIKKGEDQVRIFQQYGINSFLVPIGNSRILKNYETEAYNPEWVARVRGATGVFFIGGTEERIVDALYSADGERTPLLNAIWDVYNRGGLIAGSSAGAFVMGTTMFRADMDVLEILKKGYCEDGQELYKGLGFLGPDILVDLHFLTKGRFGRLPAAMAVKNYTIGIGVDENTTVVITDRNNVHVLGYSAAVIIDLSDARMDAAIPGFNMQYIRMTYLEKGDKFNIADRSLKVNPLKKPIDPLNPRFKGKLAYQDILAPGILTDVLYNFIDNGEPEAYGLAFSIRPDKKNNDRGFEFRFRKALDTVGYFTDAYGRDNYTVQNIILDITPITVTQPLFY